ncbi:unnamed protein product [Cunninghamella blakesleeana]
MEQHNERKEGSTKSYRHSSYHGQYSTIYSPPITTSSTSSVSSTTSSIHSPKLRFSSNNNSNKLESSSSIRHFHSNPFGQPPGLINKNATINNNNNSNNNNNINGGVNDGSTKKSDHHHPYYYSNQDLSYPPIPTTSTSSPLLSSSNRVAPLKELQKMITDLKKENFDLKLQIYHMENTLKKEDDEKIKLMNENKILNSNLEQCLHQKRELELALDQDIYFLQRKEDDHVYNSYHPKTYYDVSTQTINDQVPSSSSSLLYHQHHHLFPTDPASFGLLSSRTNTNPSSIETKSFDTIVDQFSNVKLTLPKKPFNK